MNFSFFFCFLYPLFLSFLSILKGGRCTGTRDFYRYCGISIVPVCTGKPVKKCATLVATDTRPLARNISPWVNLLDLLFMFLGGQSCPPHFSLHWHACQTAQKQLQSFPVIWSSDIWSFQSVFAYMVIFVGKFFGNMVISITTHWSFRLYGPFLAGPDVDHISGIDCKQKFYMNSR